MVAQTTPTIDVHAHILTEETIRLLHSEAPKVAPKLSDIDDQFEALLVSPPRHRGRGISDRIADIEVDWIELELPGFHPGEVQDVVDDRQQGIGG